MEKLDVTSTCPHYVHWSIYFFSQLWHECDITDTTMMLLVISRSYESLSEGASDTSKAQRHYCAHSDRFPITTWHTRLMTKIQGHILAITLRFPHVFATTAWMVVLSTSTSFDTLCVWNVVDSLPSKHTYTMLHCAHLHSCVIRLQTPPVKH